MIFLVTFAFLAGIITILSPCILPILPIVLASGVNGIGTSKSRPFGVVLGFILSFTFFTLFLSSLVRLLGIPGESLRYLSVFIVASFGLSFLVPKFQNFIERKLSRVSNFVPDNHNKQGFVGGLLIGFSIGLLWTPCVGPILASVISLAITGTVTFDTFIITLSYSVGTAIPMFLIVVGGRNLLNKVPWLLANVSYIQKAFGMLMILTALGIFFNIDRKFQSYILKTFPNYGVGLTKIEEVALNQNQSKSKVSSKGTIAPEIIPGGDWFNSKALTLSELKGKVVLIDFWTYSCINCQRTLPYLRQWNEKYKDNGLVIISVHSPEFEFEKKSSNVLQAIKDFKIEYPVVQDNSFTTWRAYDNSYWPAKYLIDKDGYIRYTHFGEGGYDDSEKAIQELLLEAGASNVSTKVENPTYQVTTKTPETYLGTGRNPFKNGFKLVGDWDVTSEYASPQKGSSLLLNFEAKEVFLVMRTSGSPVKVKVYLDDQLQGFGEDNINGIVTVNSDKLYRLIKLAVPGKHKLRLEYEDDNAEVFAFTFG